VREKIKDILQIHQEEDPASPSTDDSSSDSDDTDSDDQRSDKDRSDPEETHSHSGSRRSPPPPPESPQHSENGESRRPHRVRHEPGYYKKLAGLHLTNAMAYSPENPLDASDDPFPLLALTAGAVGSEPRTLSQALSGNDAGKSSQDLKTSPSSPIATSSRSSWDRMGKSTTKPSPLLPKSPRFVSYSPTPHSSTGRLIRSMSLALTSMQKSTKRSIWSPLQVS
jgi:hypothetical protein